MIRIVFLTGMFFLFAVAANGEYYKYTDENGTIRFTDDMSQIPASQRDEMEQFKSENGSAGTTAASSYGASDSGSRDKQIPKKYTAPATDTLKIRAAELNKIQAKLTSTRQSLEKERKELEARYPSENAKKKDRAAYSMMVDALNSKIKAYERDLNAFEEKVKAFNSREEAPEE